MRRIGLCGPAGIVAVIGLALCGCKERRNEKPPVASLSGRVFVQLQDGNLVRAAGRTVTLSSPTPDVIKETSDACSEGRRKHSELLKNSKSAEEFRRKSDELDLWTMNAVTSELSRDSVATVITDDSGNYSFADIPAGVYWLTSTQIDGRGAFSWATRVSVKTGVANPLMLGTDASELVNACGMIWDDFNHLLKSGAVKP